MIKFLKKIFLPFKEVRSYTILLILFVVATSSFIYSGGFLDLPYVVIFLAPNIAIFTWPITIILCWFIASLLVKLQRKILPNNKRQLFYSIFIILFLILSMVSARIYPTFIIKLIPVQQICWMADNWGPSGNNDGDECYTTLAIKKNNLDMCGDINFILGRRACYTQMAIFNNDITICEKYIDKIPNYVNPDYDINACKHRVQRGK